MPSYKDVPKGELYDNPNPNRGKLLRGNLGNRGGNANSGRPPEEVRGKCRESFFQRIDRLEGIIDSDDSKGRDVISAMELLGKYGGLLLVAHTQEPNLDDLSNEELEQLDFIVSKLTGIRANQGSQGP